MHRFSCSAVAAVLTAVTMASAVEAQTGRFAMTPTADGVLRLDTQTGNISHCKARGTGWACESVADDRLALQGEIDRLVRENSRLERELEGLRAGLAPPSSHNAPPGAAEGDRPKPDAHTGALPKAAPQAEPDDKAENEAEAAPKRGGEALRTPSDSDVDKLMAFFERMVRRFHDMVEGLKQQDQENQPQRL